MSSVLIRQGTNKYALSFREGDTVLSVLQHAGISLPAYCGGKGRCGKCRVSVNGVLRLACKTVLREGDSIELPAGSSAQILSNPEHMHSQRFEGEGISAAVDLGTTTIVVQLWDCSTGERLAERGEMNEQASFGADVVSRMAYAQEHEDGLSRLSETVRSQILRMISDCLPEGREVKEITVAGNTVMQHFLAGLSTEKIARAPYIPDMLFRQKEAFTLGGIPLRLVPCISGFVGGDITAGMYASRFDQRKGLHLFLDIGTNGEIAMCRDGEIHCCAAAAGPAFEGAGIACGMPGLSGAISHITWDGELHLETVGGTAPKGICGSGLLDLIAVLLRTGCIDESGRLLPPEESGSMSAHLRRDSNGNGCFYLTKDVFLTASDVRAVQLAKAAIAAGISVLLKSFGAEVSELESISLAGGFGCFLAPVSAAAVSLLPFADERVKPIGNASLAGAAALAANPAVIRKMTDIAQHSQYIELSGHPDFTVFFAQHMSFGGSHEWNSITL